MKSDLETKLSNLTPMQEQVKSGRYCKICNANCLTFDVVDFNKFCNQGNFYKFGLSGVDVEYLRCESCGFIFTDFFDDWNVDDFSKYIYNDDYQHVDPEYISARPERMAQWLFPAIGTRKDLRILDYGCGNGQMIETLRNQGCVGISGFDPVSYPHRPQGGFDLIFAFEVIEHSPTPIQTFTEILSFLDEGGCFVFSQTLQPENITSLRGSWWYLGPRNGHVSLFSGKTLSVLAEKFSLQLRRINETVFALSRGEPSSHIMNILERLGFSDSSQVLTLYSPKEADVNGQWNDLEVLEYRTYFRWTASELICWPAFSLMSAMLEVRIPVLNKISETFAEESYITVNGQRVDTYYDRNFITASISRWEPGSMCEIALHTPSPLCPRSINLGPDDRALGLAVPADCF